MWKKILISVLIIVVIAVIVLLTVYFIKKNSNNEPTNLEAKVTQEIKYLDDKLISMLNSFNNISYQNFTTKTDAKNKSQSSSKAKSSEEKSEGQESGEESGGEEEVKESKDTLSIPNSILLSSDSNSINWNELKYEVENLYGVWDTVIADLTAINVNKENIIMFSDILNNLTKNIKEENKINSMSYTGKLYGLLVKYVEEYSKDKEKIDLYNIKLHVLNSYIFAESNKWDESKKEADSAVNLFGSIMTNAKQDQNQTESKAYIQLNELRKGIELKDKEIYLINYKNLIKELTNI